jgi:hypothetical protein
MTRPRKLTPETHERIVGAVREGNQLHVAAAYAGVSKSTFKEWCQRGRCGEEPFFAFIEALDEAMAAAEVSTVAVVDVAAKEGDWKAAAYLLDRRDSLKSMRLARMKTREDIEASKTRRLTSLEWDSLLANASESERDELRAIAAKIQSRQSR